MPHSALRRMIQKSWLVTYAYSGDVFCRPLLNSATDTFARHKDVPTKQEGQINPGFSSAQTGVGEHTRCAYPHTGVRAKMKVSLFWIIGRSPRLYQVCSDVLRQDLHVVGPQGIGFRARGIGDRPGSDKHVLWHCNLAVAYQHIRPFAGGEGRALQSRHVAGRRQYE